MRGRISEIRPGDVVGFGGCDCLSVLIQIGTLGWPGLSLSHVGIAVEWPGFRHPLLVEATALLREPCAVTGKVVDGVQAHYLRSRIVGYPGRVWHYPLAKPLGRIQRDQLYGFCKERLGVAYDALGAWLARDTLWAATHRPLEDLTSYFCSEFVVAAHRACWILPEETNASVWSPNRLVRMEGREGITRTRRRLK